MRKRFESLQVPGAVMVGGALGSLLRWGLSEVWPAGALPWATLATNLTGSLALGVVLVVGELVGPQARHHARSYVHLWRPFMATGVLGGFTTFSTLVLETHRLGLASGALYLLVSVLGGVSCFAIGNRWARHRFGVTS